MSKKKFETLDPKDSPFRDVLYAKKDGVATITFNRPDAYNAYTTETLRELARAFEDASFDDAVAVVVLTGVGDRAFCTGGDVKEYAEDYLARPHDYWKYMAHFCRYIEGILDCGKPVIARLNGIAVGGGNESHLACDLSIMAEHAYVGQVGSRVGSVAAGGATQWLPLAVGDRRARWMLFTNDKIPALRAKGWGLVNEVVPSVTKNGEFVENASPEEIAKAQKKQDGYAINLSRLDEAVDALAKRLMETFPECLRYTKEQTNFWKKFSWHQSVGHAREWLALHYTSREPYEGMRAFVEKRAPDHAGIRAELAKGRAAEFVHGALVKECRKCGAKGLPEDFAHCGRCGEKI